MGERNRTSSDFSRDYDDGYGVAGRNQSDKPRSKVKIIIICVLCAVVVIALAVGIWGYVFIDRVASQVEYEPLDPIFDRSFVFEDPDSELSYDSDVHNILICGVDGDSSDYGRSDSMMLLSIDKANDKLKLTSFQRDTYVYIPDPDGGYNSKLTNAYSYGGTGLAMRTIEYNFGVRIDNYITVNFETFRTIVDILGGVELDLTDREILYINSQIEQNGQDDYLDATEGKVKLNGTQALWHARNRGGVVNGEAFYEDTDWDRTQRQRDFLRSIVGEIKDTSVFNMIEIADKVSPYITTDLTKSELKSLIFNCIFYRSYDVKDCSMPSEDTWTYADNAAGNVIFVNDWQAVTDDLYDYIYED